MRVTLFLITVIVCFIAAMPVQDTYAQDTIIKKNGDILRAKIIEVGTEEVKFKIYGQEDSPIIILNKSEIKKATVGGQTVISEDVTTESTGKEDVIVKKDGDILKVKVMDIGTDEVKFKLYNKPDGPTISIKKADIKTMKVDGQTVIDSKGGSGEDLIIKKDGSIIKAKISEIGTDEVKFKLYNNPDGPILSLKKSEINSVKVDGQSVYEYKADPRSISNAAILDKASTLKFHFFSPLSHHLAFSYEWMKKPGFNLEAGFGIYGIGVSPWDKALNISPRGAFVRFGPKFLLGSSSEVEVEGIKYSHPIKGRYFKPEITLSVLSLTYRVDTGNIFTGNGTTSPGTTSFTNKYQSLVINLIYGRQRIYGNTITLSYYFGLGYGFESKRTIGTRPTFWYGDFDWRRYSYWYMGKNFPLTITAGFAIGYILRTPDWLTGKKAIVNRPPTRHSMDK